MRETLITELPTEVLGMVASYLDLHSAISFSLASRYFRQPADSRLWRHVSVPITSIGSHPTRTHSIPRLDQPGIGPQDLSTQTEISRTVFKYLIKLFEGVPWRRGMVRKLDLTFLPTVPKELVEVIQRVSGGLEELNMSCIEHEKYDGHEHHDNVFATLTKPLLALRRVKFDLLDQQNTALQALFRLAPNLRSIHLVNRPTSTSPPFENLPALVNLHKLTVEISSTHNLPLTQIIRVAPNLKWVSILDNAVGSQPQADDATLEALGQLQDLKDLEVTSACLHSLAAGGFESVEDLTVVWSREGLHDQATKALIIPPLPSLRTYQLLVSPYAPKPVHTLEFFLSPNLASMRLLSTVTPSHICLAPSLTIISCPNHLFPSISLSGYVNLPKPRDHAFQGVIIYSWTNNQANGDELIHVRNHVGIDEDQCTGKGCFICPLGWNDKVWWNDEEIPMNVLGAVYAAAGVQIMTMEPERGMALDERGWEVLRYWAAHHL